MGLFDKKYCDICGEKIGLLGNRKLEDGNLCKDCAAKLSPWFSERRHSTVDSIKAQLDYREQNKSAVQSFHATKSFGECTTKIFVDENQRKFAICAQRDFDNANPDIIDCSDVMSVNTTKTEHKEEVKFKNAQGQLCSYTPPRYKYSYDVYCAVNVNHPYIDEVKIKLNNQRIEGVNTTNSGLMNGAFNAVANALAGQSNGAGSQVDYFFNMGNQVSMMLTSGGNGMGMNQQMGNGYGQQQMNNGMNQQMMGNGYGQQQMNNGMNQQMMGNGYGQQQMNNGMNQQGLTGMISNAAAQMSMVGNNGMNQQQMGNGYGQQMNNGMNQQMMNNGAAQQMNMSANTAAPASNAVQSGTWTCACGATNEGKFCEFCGSPRQ